MEKRKQWSFRMSKDNTWSWHVRGTDMSERDSAREFETLAECIVDAKKHGYVVITVSDERRRNPVQPALE